MDLYEAQQRNCKVFQSLMSSSKDAADTENI